jgi:predicted ATPase
MIQKLIIRNFKCLRDVTVNLEPFTVFVGANGSGKTSILQALDLLCRTYHSQLKQLESDYLGNRTFGSVEAVELACTVDGETYQYQIPSAELKNSPAKRPGGLRIESAEGQSKPPKGVPRSLWLRLDVNLLRNTQPSQNIRDMEPNGQGMHRALSSMLLERRDDFSQLEKDLNRIVPSIKRLQPTAEHEIRFDTINGKGLRASQVSEGTLLTLGLLTAIHGANKPGLLLLDDIDRALHPRAQWELIGLLRGVLQTNPEIQIAATTHSPYLLDKMEPIEVRVTTLRADGSAATEPMTQHPKYEKWKEEFHSGEMWSVFGEEWVAEPLGVAQ